MRRLVNATPNLPMLGPDAAGPLRAPAARARKTPSAFVPRTGEDDVNAKLDAPQEEVLLCRNPAFGSERVGPVFRLACRDFAEGADTVPNSSGCSVRVATP